MKKLILTTLSLTVTTIFFMSCGDSSSSSNSTATTSFNNVTSTTMGSAPMITNAVTTASFETTVNSTHMSAIQSFFKLECHMNSAEEDFCPTGIAHTYETGDERKLTVSTLIGLVYHAIMYGKNIYGNSDISYQTCAKGDSPITLTNQKPTYTTNGTTSENNNLIINIAHTHDCVASFTYGGSTNWTTYHKATDGTKFALITSRKNAVQEGYSNSSDIFQVYASQIDTATKTPKLVAANLASYNTMNQRSIIITNATTNKFIAKYQTKDANNNQNTIAAFGKAGVGTDGTWVSGYYIVASKQAGDQKLFCIQNGETPKVVAESNCSDLEALGTMTSTDWTNLDIATFMALSTEEATYLGNFITKLTASTALDADEVPASHDVFPDSFSGN